MKTKKIKSNQWLRADPEGPCPECDKVRAVCRHCGHCKECCRCPTCVCGEIHCDTHELCAGWPAKGCLGWIDHDEGHYEPNPAGGVDLMFCDRCEKRRAKGG